MKLAKQIIEETDGKICKNCLGRKLSKTIEGTDNIDRADKVCYELDINLDDADCVICNNLFDKLDEELYKKIDDKINQLGIEFDTFLVGSKIDKSIQKRDEEFSEKFDLSVETIKKEVNRLIGLGIWEIYDKEAEFESQDIVFNVDLVGEPKVKIQINPLYIEGKYNKLKRGIPQTKWPCTKCKGRGCEECNFTGKQYPESVEELISEHFLKLTKGREAKFHGAGREDIDVLMLGSGRPFVLEIKEPKIRKLDLQKLEEEINKINEGKTSYHNLHVCERRRKAEIKQSSPDTYKVYRALVKCDEAFDEVKLEELTKLNEIHQQTPLRVLRRRADKVRIKHVLDLSYDVIDEKTFSMRIKTEGGLYIKELISGDEGRSHPNVGEILGVNAICEQLDVIEVSEK
ncbi:MAG: tRNA pseudouridine(54/55) synthase Pus10 [Methanobrevibacter sp.]|uniref:tRNA pseudouridine(54/55) synthase Pus10 n=1 Tax=Methanobrevibacter sp. TaxID=66852 RepID=UPI0025FE6F22|nr:tRNA pseudouridine(54/55) synthase Pus10 [Methanobrevibacter sp.]MBR3112918.1 tRNA pseudouridine(54/55) synthase Pus10 [Methanobrevibacter sp.]MBR6992788.1 tRNA pseudouridine(54/55) synthase Pus10 [Methanobrevibacter sp.]